MLGFIWLIAGLVLVVKGADWLVDGACSLARRLGVSDLAIGLTVVAFGTSLPEMVVNIAAVLQSKPEMAVGNITGSNICNVLLILGAASLFCPLGVRKNTTWKEIPFSLLAGILLLVMASDRWLDGAPQDILSRTDGFGLLALFVIFLAYIAGMARELPEVAEQGEHAIYSTAKSLLLLAAGLVLLIVGGKLVVVGAVQVATALGLSESFVAVTLVAVGTSLPELATSVVAAYKKKADIAIGNVVGSNIFNIFLILGTSSVLGQIPVPGDLRLSLYVGVLAVVLLLVFLLLGRRYILQRWQGVILLAVYGIYLICQPR
ncbi:MAG: calcium/sodium antiporter [Sedimentisphaerales bacterium]|nr:calcium/sodium antiporter [Sedimentisphaerales bacterium]